MKRFLPLLLFTAFVVCTFGVQSPAVAQTFTIDRNTPIEVSEVGAFGNAKGIYKELLETYLMRVLNRRHATGSGDPLSITIESQAEHWSDLDVSTLNSTADIDTFEVIVQPDQSPQVIIKGKTLLGAGFGVIDFIERELGVRFLFPGDLGTHIPVTQTVELKPSSRTQTPEFFSRLFSGMIYTSDELKLKHTVYAGAIHRNSMFIKSHDYFKSLKLHMAAPTSHNFMHIYPYEELKDSHPEMFPIKDGKRLSLYKLSHDAGQTHAWQPCYANPNAYTRAVAKATAGLTGASNITYSLGVNDGRNVLCECEYCQSIGHPDTYFRLVNHVADSVKHLYPPRMVGFIAYGSATRPTPNLKLADNVLVTITGGDTNKFETWAKHASHLSAYEYMYGFWMSVPTLPFKAMATNAQFYDRMNVKGLYAEVYPLWAFDAPKVYIRARLMWDKDADVNALLKEYCDAAYGNGSDDMVKLYLHWATKMDDLHVPDGKSQMTPMRIRQDAKGQFARCTQSDYDLSQQLLDSALSKAESLQQRKRIEMVQTFIQYSGTLYGLFSRQDLAFEPGATFNVSDYVTQVDQLLEQRATLFKEMEAHPEWFLGSSVKPEDIQGDRWEKAWAIEAQMKGAMKSAIYNRTIETGKPIKSLPKSLPLDVTRYAKPGKTIEPRMINRPTHPWYPDERYIPIEYEMTKDGLQFKTTGNEPDASGLLKRHWLAPLFVGEPIDGKSAHIIELDLHGADGELTWFVNSGHNNRNQTVVNAVEKFAKDGESMKTRAVAEMVRLDPRTGLPMEIVPGQTASEGNLNMYLRWTPNSRDAKLTGTLRVKRVSLESVVGESMVPEEPDFGF